MVEELVFDGQEERVKHRQNGTGWIEVIVGSMFSGKSEELIRRLRRARIARQKVQVFKPKIDDRFSKVEIVSHSDMRHDSIAVANAEELLANVEKDTEVIGIDEGQFLDEVSSTCSMPRLPSVRIPPSSFAPRSKPVPRMFCVAKTKSSSFANGSPSWSTKSPLRSSKAWS